MSKIGKKIIKIPADVTVNIDGQTLKVKGPKGELVFVISKEVGVKLEGDQLLLSPAMNTKKTMALWGTSRAIIANLVRGVKEGFEKKLEIEGIGFKAELKGKNLVFNLGFSHQVNFPVPDGINVTVEKNMITVSGISKELVGQAAANIRALKKPEPYKGKGIHYLGEVIRRKAGKKVAGTTG
jgi:large subunit ribosomal protein L6